MKLTKKELDALVNSTTEQVLQNKGLAALVNKVDLTGGNNGKGTGTDTKELKTLKFFQAMYAGNLAAAKDISGAVADNGATLLPTEFIADLIDKVVKQPYALRKYVRVIPVSNRSGNEPTVEGGVAMVWRDSDAQSANNTTPKFGNVGYTVHAIDGYTAMGRETLADTPINVYNKLLELYTDAFLKAENTAILVGSGEGQPSGIRVCTDVPTVGIADKTNGALAVDDILGLEFSIPSTYRPGSVWVMGSKALRQVRIMKDLQGRPLFVKGDITQGKPDTLCGYPVLELDGIIPENLTVGTVAGTTEIMFGNLQGYYLFDRNEYTTELNTSSDTAFFKNQVIVKCSNRYDGKVVVPKSLVRLNGIKVGA